MRSSLLLNDIKVGEIDIDDMSGVMTPYLQTFIEGDGYTVLMVDYVFNFKYGCVNENVIVNYLLSTYPEDNSGEQIEFTFNTTDMDFDEKGQPFEFHYMTQV